MKQLPEDPLRQFWLDSKKEAPKGFSDFIMQNLPQPSPLPAWLKKPLLSYKVIAALLGLLIALAILLNRFGGTGSKTNPLWYQNTQKAIDTSLGWFGNGSALLPTMAVLSVALVLLIGLDRLLKRLISRGGEQH